LKVMFTRTARAQFLDAISYIRQDSPASARRFRLKAEQSLRRLEDHPDSGRPIPEFPGLPHREVIVRPYRFFYRCVENVVWILAVWHTAQIPEDPAH